MEKWNRLLVVVATILLLFAFVAVGVRLMMSIHHTLLLFALGGLVAYALDPLVERVRVGRLSRPLSVGLVYLGLLIIVGLGVWWLGGHLVAQVTDFQRGFPRYREWALARAGIVDQRLAARHIHFSLTSAIQHPPPEVTKNLEHLGGQILPLLRHVATDLTESVIVLLIALYFLIFAKDMREKFNGLVPLGFRERLDLWETDVNRILGGFVRGQLVIALIMGAAAGLGCLALGIGPWLLIGLFVVVAALIPVFGPYLGAIPAVIAALVGPTHFHNPVAAAALILAWFIFINEAGGKILYPRLVGSALGLHEVLVLFVLFAGLELDGIIGTLFAAPVTALAIVTVVHLYRYWQGLPDTLLSNTARRDARRQGQPSPAPAAPEPLDASHDHGAQATAAAIAPLGGVKDASA